MVRTLGIIAWAIALMGMAGCQKGSSGPSKVADPNSLGMEKIEVPQTQPSPGSEPLTPLFLAYPPGRYELHEMSHSVLRFEGTTEALRKEKDNWYILEASPPDSAGRVTLKLRTRRARYYRSRNAEMCVDTDAPASLERYPVGAALKASLQNDQLLVIDRKLQFVDASGFEKTIESARSASPAAGELLSQLKDVAKYGTHSTCLPSLWLLPKEAVGVGGVWMAAGSLDVPGTMSLQSRGRCRLAKVAETPEGRLATVEFVATETAKVDGIDVPQLGGLVLEVAQGATEISGRFTLNVETGILVEHSEWRRESMSVSGPPGSGGPHRGSIRRLRRTTLRPLDGRTSP